MKVLIVDDEQHAREAVKLLVPWQEYGIDQVWEADNGEEAKRIITELLPDIVLTDMQMPITGGVALMQWITQHYPSIKMIVISGFSDFDYLRHTLKYGGQDYLLKPIDPLQLNDAMSRVVEEAKKEEIERLERSRQSIEMNQFKPVYWDKIFSRLLSEPAVFSTVKEQLEQEFGCPAQGTACVAAVCSLEPVPPALLRKFRGERDLLAFAVANIINDMVRLQWKAGYAFRHWNNSESIVIVMWNGLKHLPSRLQELSSAISSTLRVTLHIGVGSEVSLPEGLGSSADQARLSLHHRNLLLTSPAVHFYERSVRSGMRTFPHLGDMEEQCKLALLSRNERELEAVCSGWMNRIKEMPEITLEHIDVWQREFQVIRTRWMQTLLGGGEKPVTPEFREQSQQFPVFYDDHGLLSVERTQEKLLQLLLAFSSELAERQRNERNVISDIKDYINHHLNEDVSLQQLASRFYLSREYVSRRFKQETGQNLSEYVERLRIDKAKLLLGNPMYRITEIAEMVGYPDEKYFSKVFKKHIGCSPNQFRKKA
ncbi:response regulator [Paenibacillus abyssi]|uniref:DNA-binding response regulator n=1 Tax=Paenibacillus abyssi TaxID=1340531 RepID=A0A917CTN2_9BACL|nr:response regulator [Paenibacillus abyssi]GGF97301.1 hypothetical protein GCM10010916_13170 [Paenibacillus abyssi]